MLHNVCDKIYSDLPVASQGLERHVIVGKKIAMLTHGERAVLQAQFNNYLKRMRAIDASDIEVGGAQSGGSIWMRVHGLKAPRPEFGSLKSDESNAICLSLLSEAQRHTLYKARKLDFSYTITENGIIYRWRACLYFDLGSLALNMRAITDTIFPFSHFNFHQNISKSFSLAKEKQGLILITGITGSGKSTTMDSIIDANNQTVEGHIVVIGDPIEYIHQSKKCIVRHREVGHDVLSFKDGAVQALRQDPDIIVVGEMRDPETIITCLEITDTGHKVFSTLHTCSAVESIDRIIAECPIEEQERVRNRLADVLRVIVSQKLVPSKDGKRTLAKEVLLVNASVKAAIRNKNTHEIYQMISESGKLGMVTLEQDLHRLQKERIITEQTACEFANNKKRIKELFVCHY